MTPRRAGAVFCLATALVAGAAREARADSPDAAAPAIRHVVDVVFVGEPDEIRATEASLGELLRRVGLDLRASTVERLPADSERAPPAPDVAVRAFVDLRASGGASVEIVDASTERTVERRLVAQEGSRAVLLEDVAHVVQDAAESTAHAAPPAPPPPPPPAPAPAPAPPPIPSPSPIADAPAPLAEAPRWDLSLAAFFSGSAYAHDVGTVLGAGAGLRYDGGRGAGRAAGWLFGAYHFAFGDDGLPVDLRASVWSVRVAPSLQLVDTSGFVLEVGAGGGADIFSISHGAVMQGVSATDHRTDASPMLEALVAAHLALGPAARMFVLATVDWDLDPRRYVLDSGGSRSALITPLPVRPGVALGFTFDLIHAEARR